MSPEDEPVAKAAYEELAEGYDEEFETNPYNTEMEFPATTSLIPPVAGQRILDAGCGTGIYSEWLRERGAEVVGVDVSEGMLEMAREKLGEDVPLHQGSLGQPLAFAESDSFDGIVCALVLGYVEDWRSTFAEFSRVLEPGGFLVFSTEHPVEAYVDNEDVDYFATECRTKEWDVDVPHYRRPLSEMVEPLVENGFCIDGIVEPQPNEAFREQRPDVYEKESRQPVFLCLRARLRGNGPEDSQ